MLYSYGVLHDPYFERIRIMLYSYGIRITCYINRIDNTRRRTPYVYELKIVTCQPLPVAM